MSNPGTTTSGFGCSISMNAKLMRPPRRNLTGFTALLGILGRTFKLRLYGTLLGGMGRCGSVRRGLGHRPSH